MVANKINGYDKINEQIPKLMVCVYALVRFVCSDKEWTVHNYSEGRIGIYAKKNVAKIKINYINDVVEDSRLLCALI